MEIRSESVRVPNLSHQSLGVKVEEEWGDDLIEEPQDKEKAAPIGQGVSHRRRFFNDRWILDATNSALVKRLALLRFEEHGNGLPLCGSMFMINGVPYPISLSIVVFQFVRLEKQIFYSLG